VSQARIAFLASIVVPLAACASAPQRPQALTFRTSFDATCRGGVGVESFRPPAPWEDVDPAPGAPFFDANVRVARVSWKDAGSLFGPGFTGTAARATSIADARSELALLFAELPECSRMRLTFFEGQRTTMSVVDQRAYVSGYRFESHEGAALIADPTVSTLEEGLWVGLTARRAADDREVDVELTWADVEEQPLRTGVQLLDDRDMTAVLELPLFHHSALETRAVLARGEALVLAVPVTGPKAGVLVAVVEPRLVVANPTGTSTAP